MSATDPVVDAKKRMLFYLLGKPEVCLIRFCNDKKPRSVLIYTVNDSGTYNSVDSRKTVAAMVQQRVYERSVAVSRGRVNDHSLWLVDNKKVFIFKHHIKRNILRGDIKRFRNGQRISDNIACPDTVILPFRLTADRHRAVFYKKHGSGTRQRRIRRGNKLI